jgi:hypothetical protein
VKNVNLHHLAASKCKIGEGQTVLNKLNVVSRLEKGERIVDIRHIVRFTHSSVRTLRDHADGIVESAKSATKV